MEGEERKKKPESAHHTFALKDGDGGSEGRDQQPACLFLIPALRYLGAQVPGWVGKLPRPLIVPGNGMDTYLGIHSRERWLSLLPTVVFPFPCSRIVNGRVVMS